MKRQPASDFRTRAESLFHAAGVNSWYHFAGETRTPRRTMYDYRDNLTTPNVLKAIEIAQRLGTTVEALF